jgi:transcription antitermination factor NusG
MASTILRNKGYEEFLPTYRARRRYSDRVKEEAFPLFPGYLFCRFDQGNRVPILSTGGVVRIVGIDNTPQPVAAEELAAVWRVTHSGVIADPWPHLEAGEEVMIESGALRGLRGFLVECKGSHRLVVSVRLLQRSVAVEINKENVRPVDGVSRLIARSLATPGNPAPRKLPVSDWIRSGESTSSDQIARNS